MRAFLIAVFLLLMLSACTEDPYDEDPGDNPDYSPLCVGELYPGLTVVPVDMILKPGKRESVTADSHVIYYTPKSYSFSLLDSNDLEISICHHEFGISSWFGLVWISGDFQISDTYSIQGDKFGQIENWYGNYRTFFHSDELIDLEQDFYLAIRRLPVSDSLYGWIKLKSIDHRSFQLIEYAY